jgi:hypothetical protein
MADFVARCQGYLPIAVPVAEKIDRSFVIGQRSFVICHLRLAAVRRCEPK